MTCETALLYISGHIDGVNTEEEELALQAHLSGCAECRAVLAAFAEAEAGLQELEVRPPEGFAKGVMYRIGQQTGTEKKSRFRFFGPGTAIGAVAAILVLMLGTGLIKLPTHKTASPEAAADEAMPAETFAAYGYAEAAPEAAEAPAPAEAAPEYGGVNSGDYWAEEKLTVGRPETPEAYASTATKAAAADEGPIPTEPWPADAMELCKQLDAPVLSYTDFGTELIDLLRQYAPELGERLAALTPEQTEDGRLLYRTDARTVLAVQEWLLTQIPHSDDADEKVLQSQTELMLRAQEVDPDYGFLAEIITLPEVPQKIVWPESWGEDWAERFLLEQSWQLCFPTPDEVPNGSDTAYLVFSDAD